MVTSVNTYDRIATTLSVDKDYVDSWDVLEFDQMYVYDFN